MSLTGPLTYRVEATGTALGVILRWFDPDGGGGSCRFSTPAKARRYANDVEGRTLSWKRGGTKPFPVWTASSREENS